MTHQATETANKTQDSEPNTENDKQINVPIKPVKKPAKKTPPRLLRVVRTALVSPSLKRITLSGETLMGFPSDKNGAHIKVFFPRDHQTKPQLPTLTPQGVKWPEAAERPITRTYSVRQYREKENELDVDFVLHGAHSPASGWALTADIGDYIGIAGPGGPDPLLNTADWHILAGDMTALPAISSLLEELPATAKGFAFIETDDIKDQHTLVNNSAIEVHWVLRKTENPSSTGETIIDNDVLLKKVKAVSPPMGISSISAFIGGENSAVVNIRDYLREVYGLKKSHLYAVPYWRRGQDEETYHQQRHDIMDQVY